ncbi:MAG: RNA polymerase factor sigma-54 [Gemmataceae bacterium]|nr:RNA polymerase factor sigma-54 [Gemmataceae bacterium]
MRLDTSLSQRMEQKMILAPRMIQSMEILQLAIMALKERIEHELQENPVLELKEAGQDESGEANTEIPEEILEEPKPESTELVDPERELVIKDQGDDEDFDRLIAMNEEWADHFNEEHRPSANRIDEEGDKRHDAMVNMAARPQSLQDYLNDQLAFVDVSPEDLQLLRYLISHIDERGYLAASLEDIAQSLNVAFADAHPQESNGEWREGQDPEEPPVTVRDLERALARIQKLDPLGVGARDHKECLLLQVTAETPHPDVVRALIANHLEDIQHNRLPIIQKRTGYDLETIKEAIEVLRHLNPKPGSQFVAENIPYVVPDISVDRTEDGEYEVKLLDDWTPPLYISPRYIQLYRDKASDPKAKEFLKRKIQSAQWLIEAIEQRRNTLAKVTRAIIQHQRSFLEKGPEHIEPLKMQQIADLVGVHVTTVSRAVDEKWVQTPRGIFPLKRFFGGGTQTASGEEVAWETIKQKLLEIIANEDKANPLSDEDLVAKLGETGYPVARRTVTKYRKMLHIASSRQRKVWSE